MALLYSNVLFQMWLCHTYSHGGVSCTVHSHTVYVKRYLLHFWHVYFDYWNALFIFRSLVTLGLPFFFRQNWIVKFFMRNARDFIFKLNCGQTNIMQQSIILGVFEIFTVSCSQHAFSTFNKRNLFLLVFPLGAISLLSSYLIIRFFFKSPLIKICPIDLVFK